ncbi:MAG TPA: hypothetical protein VGM12_03885 [Trebonia sp.]|jgi:hypothetical protein
MPVTAPKTPSPDDGSRSRRVPEIHRGVFAATTRRSAVTKTAGAGTVRRIASNEGSRCDMRMSVPATPRNTRPPEVLGGGTPRLDCPRSGAAPPKTGTVSVSTYRSAPEKSN